jgi:hypothetical protein
MFQGGEKMIRYGLCAMALAFAVFMGMTGEPPRVQPVGEIPWRRDTPDGTFIIIRVRFANDQHQHMLLHIGPKGEAIHPIKKK